MNTVSAAVESGTQKQPTRHHRAWPVVVAALVGFAVGSLRSAMADDGTGGRLVHAVERIAAALERCPR